MRPIDYGALAFALVYVAIAGVVSIAVTIVASVVGGGGGAVGMAVAAFAGVALVEFAAAEKRSAGYMFAIGRRVRELSGWTARNVAHTCSHQSLHRLIELREGKRGRDRVKEHEVSEKGEGMPAAITE